MKILTVMTTPFGLNGITNVVLSNYKNINKANYKMDFVFNNKPTDEIKEQFDKNGSNYYIVSGRSRNPIRYIYYLNKILTNTKYDIIHVHGNSTTMAIELLISKIKGINIRISHGHSTFTKFPIVNRILRPLFNYSYTKGLAVSKKSGNWLYDNLDYEIVENGINVSHFKFDKNIRKEQRKKLNYIDKDFVIGNIGRFSEEKNQIFLIRLINNLLKSDPKIKLLLVGTGKLENKYKKLTEELKIDKYVQFVGNQENISPFLSTMDLMIVPSLKEGLGLTILEAQASDLKVLASSEVPDEVNVTSSVSFFKLGDQKTIYKLIDQCRENNYYRENHTLYDKMYDSKYNIVNSGKKLESIYKECIHM